MVLSSVSDPRFPAVPYPSGFWSSKQISLMYIVQVPFKPLSFHCAPEQANLLAGSSVKFPATWRVGFPCLLTFSMWALYCLLYRSCSSSCSYGGILYVGICLACLWEQSSGSPYAAISDPSRANRSFTLIHRSSITNLKRVEKSLFFPDNCYHLRGMFPNHSISVWSLSPFCFPKHLS